MSLFPTYIEEDQDLETYVEANQTPKEYEIDFETGQLTGNIVEGIEAIKVWIWLAMRTARYRYVVYSWDYGNELEDLIGKGYTDEYIKSEVERMVEDALLVNENISSVTGFEVTRNIDKISVSFTANTLYGEVNINV
jgi:Protein of unknown function (DUF2634).